MFLDMPDTHIHHSYETTLPLHKLCHRSHRYWDHLLTSVGSVMDAAIQYVIKIIGLK